MRREFAFYALFFLVLLAGQARATDMLDVYVGTSIHYQWVGAFDVYAETPDGGFLQFTPIASTGDEIFRNGFEPRNDEANWNIFVGDTLRITADCTATIAGSPSGDNVELHCGQVQ